MRHSRVAAQKKINEMPVRETVIMAVEEGAGCFDERALTSLAFVMMLSDADVTYKGRRELILKEFSHDEIDEYMQQARALMLYLHQQPSLLKAKPLEVDLLRKRVVQLEIALRTSITAMDDWLHQYAGEFCDKADVEESEKRIAEKGTIAYISAVQEKNRAALIDGTKS